MDTEELEALLEAAQETDTLEFRGPTRWSRGLFVKDILAMANVVDGGRIIVGIRDGTLERVGLDEEDLASFQSEIMRDAIAPFADPEVVFIVSMARDRGGRWYVIIDVHPFDFIPVICRRSSDDVDAGRIYFRSRTGRPASAPVSNSADLRDIIDRAVVRSARRYNRLGLVLNSGVSQRFDYDNELGGL